MFDDLKENTLLHNTANTVALWDPKLNQHNTWGQIY